MSVGHRPTHEPAWFKSSYSGGNATECLEAAFIPTGVLIRDSKQSAGEQIRISLEVWRGFTTDIPTRTKSASDDPR